MASRRNFLKGVGAAGVGLTAAGMTGCANVAKATNTASARYNGPHKMPEGVRLLSMRNADGTETLGAVTDKGVIDVRAVAAKRKIAAPLTLDELLQEGNADGLKQVIAAAPSSGVPLLDESRITHGRLFTRPSKIICVGLNYRQHAREVGMQPPRVPPLFNKYNNALAAHNGTIKLPPKDISHKFDYETELLIVMGKAARNVSEADVLQYVAGYCTSNDFSARDLQLELPNSQWMIGKTLDNFAPIGPYFVSADLVGNPNNLKIETRVNGEVRQSSNTNDFIFNTQQMISYISKFWTLQPGDIIFTGTPQGVIAGYPKDKQVWLKAGDEVVSSIEKLGDLKFRLA
ncbi:fumarylacetoacetate hydrolase family protein [Noviherbaspirillum massiliense]|uniref:fumarylacetoacetate hydrolase family protein n=1 Tax=Noviherbaspirillum massiliense TaxID=1465823 RepID=UPI00031846E1|nr:fumarylacetoacetate hydrolase family protein [Noviherbaspirillum massiliense]